MDRKRRSNNLIFYNLDEVVDESSSNENRKMDSTLAMDIIQVIIPNGVSISKLMRLDGRKNGYARPLCVTFPFKKDAISILRNKSHYSGLVTTKTKKYTKTKHLSANFLMI